VVSVDVRIAAHEDYDRIKSMWSCCFDDNASFVDWYFESIYRPENTLCVWEKDTMVSSLQILPRQIFIRGAFQPVGYVVGVMTLPQYRGRGYAGHLLQAAAELMDQRGIFLSVLVSDVDPRFYRKFGWELTHSLTEMTIEAESAAAVAAMADLQFRLKPAQTDAIPLLQSYYERYCSNGRHGYFSRDSGNWRNIFADLELDSGQAYLIMNEDGASSCGYVLLLPQMQLKMHMPPKPLKIKECVYFDALDRDDGSDSSSSFPPRLMTLNLPIKTNTKPFLMTRIINLRRLLENCHVAQASSGYEGPPLSFEMALNAPELASISANTWAALILGAADNDLYQETMARLADPLRSQIAQLFPPADNYACELF
jgi:predicted acetyltransferase